MKFKKPQSGQPIPQPVRDDVRVAVNRCPFCHSNVAKEGSVVCQDCLARHHGDCWSEHGSCASCGETVQMRAGGAPLRTDWSVPSSLNSVIEQADSKETLHYSWPVFSRGHLLWYFLLGLAALPLFGLGLYHLLQCLLLSSHRVELTLGKGQFRFVYPEGLSMRTVEGTPDDISWVGVDGGSHRRLIMEVGGRSVRLLSSGSAIGDNKLRESELRWLHDVLSDWRRQSRA